MVSAVVNVGDSSTTGSIKEAQRVLRNTKFVYEEGRLMNLFVYA